MEKRKRYVGRRKARDKVFRLVMLLMLLAIVVITRNVIEDKSRFDEGTYIDQIDVSNLNVQDAKVVIEYEEILFSFLDGTKYLAPQDEVGRTLTDTSELETFLSEQNSEEGRETKNFSISPESYNVNGELIEEYLRTLSEFQEGNIHPSEDAYMRQNAIGLFEVVPEVYGNELEFSQAVSFVTDRLRNGDYSIDFELISSPENYPKILAKDLEPTVNKINTALNAEINLTLFDGSTHTLNGDFIKDWIYKKGSGEIYDIDIEGAARAFVDALNEEVKFINDVAKFMTHDGRTITLPVQWGKRATVDIEVEVEQITLELEQGGEHNRDITYLGRITYVDLKDYVEIDITKQRIYVYLNGEKILDVPCITGMKGRYDTPIGIFYSDFKAPVYRIYKYGRHTVRPWITVDGDIGIHGASEWRRDSEYTVDRYEYDGSHGCINAKDADAKKVYEYVIIGETPIIIHY